jgi:hypothetical protein
MGRLTSTALLGTVIVLTGCGAAAAKTSSPEVTSPPTVASTTTTTSPPPPTTAAPTTSTTTPPTSSTTSVLVPTAGYSLITSDLQKLLRFGGLPSVAAMPDATVNCPPFKVETGTYFGCYIISYSSGDALFLGRVTNAKAGTFEAIKVGTDITCTSFNASEARAMRSIDGCAPVGGPTMAIDGMSVIKPAVIAFSADGGNVPRNLVWSEWGTGTANAQGIIGLDNCDPDCAQGSVLTVPVTISVTDLYNNTYHLITETIQGQAPQTFPLPYSS